MGLGFQPSRDIDLLSTNFHSFSMSSQHVRVSKNNPGWSSSICWHMHFAYLKFLQFIQWEAYAYLNFLQLIHWEAYAYLNFPQCIQWEAHIVTFTLRIETFFQYIQLNHMLSHKLYQATFPSLHTMASTCWHIHFRCLNFLPNVKIEEEDEVQLEAEANEEAISVISIGFGYTSSVFILFLLSLLHTSNTSHSHISMCPDSKQWSHVHCGL